MRYFLFYTSFIKITPPSYTLINVDECVSCPTVSEWETGKKDPSGDRLRKLAEFFQVDELDILGRGMFVRERTPITNEARIVSGGMDKLSQQQREQVLNVFKAMFPDVFNNEGNE